MSLLSYIKVHSSSKTEFCIYLRDNKQGIRTWTEDEKVLGKDLKAEKALIYFFFKVVLTRNFSQMSSQRNEACSWVASAPTDMGESLEHHISPKADRFYLEWSMQTYSLELSRDVACHIGTTTVRWWPDMIWQSEFCCWTSRFQDKFGGIWGFIKERLSTLTLYSDSASLVVNAL